MEAIESEVRRMENDVAEIKTLLSSPEAFPSPREESLKVRTRSQIRSDCLCEKTLESCVKLIK